MTDETIRLDTLLSQAGYCARRKTAMFLTDHQVFYQQQRLTENGIRLPLHAELIIDGQNFKRKDTPLYIALNKPKGYICSSNDPQGRPLALSLIPQSETTRLYNVGRLDYDSCGLIFFTNDGHWAQKLAHPSGEIEKEYYVETSQFFSIKDLLNFKKGLIIEGERYRLKDFHLPENLQAKNELKAVNVVLTEGKNREIRRVFESFNAPVKFLQRIRIGSVHLGNLKEGSSRILMNNEINSFDYLTKIK